MDTEGLSIICAGLGSVEKDEQGNSDYIREEYCSDNLKDLLRFLRRDDPSTRDVFKQVCKWETVSKDLIPIIEYCQDDRNLVLNAVKVLVFLTMPLDAMSKDFNEQLEYLWGIKHAITSSNVVAVIVSLLERPLENLECKAFSDDDWKLVQLVLTLFRNILAVQDISAHQKALGSVTIYLSLRDDFIDLLFRENVMDLIIIITQHVSSCRYLRHDNLLLLEIYYHIFMGQDAKVVAKVCLDEAKVDVEEKPCLESLKCIMQEEIEKRKLTRLHASRHSKFSGAFTRLTLDGSKTMCKGMPSSASCDKLLKPEKVHRGPSKRIVKDYAPLPTTKKGLLERLHDFLNQFLTGGYNVLMQSIAQDIEKEHHAIQTSDVLMFFHLAQFVTSFQYHKFQLTKSNEDANNESAVSDDDDDSTRFKGELCGPIAATLNDSMFSLVIAKWHFAFEGLKELKNNAFLSVAGSLLKTLIRILDLVLKIMPEKSREPQTARTILYKLFYDQTDQGLTQFLLNMVRTFDAHKQPKSDLADLVEIIHVVTRLMEKLQAHGTLRVARKSRKAKKKKKMKNKEQKTEKDETTMPNGNQPPSSEDVPPYADSHDKESSIQTGSDKKEENANVGSKVDDIEISRNERQNSGGNIPKGDHGEAKQIHDPLGNGELDDILEPVENHVESGQTHDPLENGESDDILKPVKNPGESGQTQDPLENGESDDILEPVENHGESGQIHDLLVDGELHDVLEPLGDHGESTQFDDNVATGADDYESSADEQHTRTNEVDFQMTPLLLSLATSTIISNLCWLLKFYKSNSIATNHYILCLLRKISDDLDLAPMLYQLSCLVIFYDILNEQKACPRKEYENLVQFLTSLVRRMLRKMKDHPLLFVDLLFWKNRKDCHYINVVGIQHEVDAMRKEVRKWDHADETGPSQSKEGTRKSLADALGDDEYEVLIPNQPNLEKKASPSEGNLQGDTKKKRRLVLNNKLEEEIRALYDKYKDNLNCNQLIAEALDPHRNISPAQVSRKCKKLGLQLPSKKRAHLSKDNDSDKEGRLELDNSLQDANHAHGLSDMGRPMQARKRVRAIDDSEKIKNLYEHFKDHKRCSHMIAKELDPDGAVTAAQVSRKLKKLGLRTSRMRGEVNKKEMNEASTDGEDDLDNLTLSMVRKRSKNEDSSSNKKLGSSNHDVQSSDDELTLGSILKKSKRGPKEPEGKRADDSTNQVTVSKDTGDQSTQSLEERDERGEDMDVEIDTQRLNSPNSSSTQEAARSTYSGEKENPEKYDEFSDSENGAIGHGNLGSASENDATPDTSRKQRSLVLDDHSDKVHDEHHYSDLEDSGDDEQTPSALLESSIKRRKLRVVMDFDDDE